MGQGGCGGRDQAGVADTKDANMDHARTRFTAVCSSLSRRIAGIMIVAALLEPGAAVAQSAEPANVGDAKIAAADYYKSGAYERDLTAMTAQASAWIAERAPQVQRPALVLDVDDTALSNWQVITVNDFGRIFHGPCWLPKGPCNWVSWDLLGRTPAITQTLALFKQARQLKVAVFFISGRDESQRAATVRNLRAAGYGDHRGLYLPAKGAQFASAADFKAAQRRRIEAAGYTIIANVGDQPSDLAGGSAEKTFLLPNPFYRIP